MKPDGKTLPGALQLEIVLRRPGSLRVNPRNARTHSRQQIRQIADSMLAFGNLSPIALDESGTIVYGHGRLAAAKLLGLKLVPTVTVTRRSASSVQAIRTNSPESIPTTSASC